jgi:hypothetical protein
MGLFLKLLEPFSLGHGGWVVMVWVDGRAAAKRT